MRILNDITEVWKIYPDFLNNNLRWSVISLPPISILSVACGNEKPSKTGTEYVTPSPESNITPDVLPLEYLKIYLILIKSQILNYLTNLKQLKHQ